MAKEWTLEDIRTKARIYSGRRSTNDLSDEDLDDYINQFYQNELPGILGVHEFDSWVTFDLTADDGDVNIDTDITGGTDIHVIEAPITVAGNEVTLYTDPVRFKEIWPEDGEPYTSGDVEDVLLLGRDLYFRPPPDSADEVQFLNRRTIPTALASASDKPTDPRWGKLIAAGAAKILLEEKEGDTTTVLTIIQEQKIIFTREKQQMMQKTRTSRREL